MAEEESDQESRTEAPSPRRMAQALEQGDLPIGHDAAPVAGLAAATAALIAAGPSMRDAVAALFGDVAGAVDRAPFGDLPRLLVRPVMLALVVCGAAALGAAAATVAQTKGGFWSAKIGLDPTRLWRGVALAKMFTKDFLVDLLLALVKVVAIGLAGWLAVRDDFVTLPAMLQAEPAAQVSWIFGLVATAAKPILLVIVAIAGIDLAVVRYRYMQKMKMTKEEAKREYKEDEGDPTARGKRKKRHREIVSGQARREVPRADAVVVNPTHIAVAIRYRRDEGRAPRVIAKGKGLLAEHMRALAREHGVPIVEDVPLARLLYRKVKVGREIPAATYKAVATILAFVYRVTGRSAGGGAGARA
jgi:flagellar biosynthesis protein FlhB